MHYDIDLLPLYDRHITRLIGLILVILVDRSMLVSVYFIKTITHTVMKLHEPGIYLHLVGTYHAVPPPVMAL